MNYMINLFESIFFLLFYINLSKNVLKNWKIIKSRELLETKSNCWKTNDI